MKGEKMELNKEILIHFEKVRNELESSRGELRIKTEEFEKENTQIIEVINSLSESLNNDKEQITNLAKEQIIQNTNEKKLLGGIGIQIRTNLIYEEKKAFDWAKEHGLFLQLDSRKFEKHAKSNEDLDFVKKEEKITVTFPKQIQIEGAE